jgi:hypothetical protein
MIIEEASKIASWDFGSSTSAVPYCNISSRNWRHRRDNVLKIQNDKNQCENPIASGCGCVAGELEGYFHSTSSRIY